MSKFSLEDMEDEASKKEPQHLVTLSSVSVWEWVSVCQSEFLCVCLCECVCVCICVSDTFCVYDSLSDCPR